ncbi:MULTISPECIES: hypothetical protein [unclassified Bradyrhizobium]|uniref:hypothetical protein n=1 Tax=unclassified Bradyrhizobium TaxID=2631580 RepID=UPI003395B0D1
MENVVTIEELKQKKLLRDQQEAIELSPVAPGETMIGYLTDDERTIYTEMVTLDNELQESSKELQARAYEMVAASVRKSDKPMNINQNLDDSILFPNNEEAEEHFKIETKLTYLKAVFAMCLRDRYGHTGIYGVRSNFCVIRKGYRHKLPDELKNAHS